MAEIDIVIPVYNAENYIVQCINSIRDQIFTDFRVIAVDDGSTDRSGEILDSLAKEDRRIEVIHQKNGGLSNARNAGLKVLKSPYLCFVDADDLVHRDYLSCMYELIKEYEAELVISGYHILEAGESADLTEAGGYENIKVYGDTTEYEELFKDETVKLTCVWNKLYRAELWENRTFPEGKVFEDDYVFYPVLDRSKRTVITDTVLYEYRMVEGSVSHEPYNLKMLNHVEAKREQIEYFHKAGKQRLVEISLDAYIYWIWWNKQNMEDAGMDYRKYLKPYLNYLRTAVRYIRLTSTFPMKKILKYWYLAYLKKN